MDKTDSNDKQTVWSGISRSHSCPNGYSIFDLVSLALLKTVHDKSLMYPSILYIKVKQSAKDGISKCTACMELNIDMHIKHDDMEEGFHCFIANTVGG